MGEDVVLQSIKIVHKKLVHVDKIRGLECEDGRVDWNLGFNP